MKRCNALQGYRLPAHDINEHTVVKAISQRTIVRLMEVLEQHTSNTSRRRRGRIAIIDYKREGFVRRVFGHAMERDVIVSEMESAGYRLESDHNFLPKQHFLVFSP